MEQMRLMLERNHNQPQPPVIPLRQENSEPIYERFRKQHPIDFVGGADPYIAEEWIKSLEVIFEYMRLSDEDKVSCAVYMLKMGARNWWETIRVTPAAQNLTWDDFKELFYHKYFNSTARATKVEEFLRLRQENGPVGEYIRKYEELSRFVHGLGMITKKRLSTS